MIQRIQSLYWLGAAICLTFLNFGVSMLNFNGKDFHYEFYLFGWKKLDASNKIIGGNDMYFYIATILIFAFIVQAIFSFKSLKRQMKLANVIIYLHALVVLFLVSLFAFGKQMFGLEYETTEVSFGFYALFLSLIFSFLATQGVKKDKKLLDSVDRIR
jgi:hypothetical protein